ncbi:MAG: 16S rRNA (uracil(1498)-N(3))-methyltransferase [Sulfuricella sp.]|nr:16S rRNA (uracil(1498)-N(3))-methyltransferase [Sulfuricella sp.]
MTVSRFYCPEPLAGGTQVALPEQAAHHAAKVLRLREGDAIALFDGRGGEYAATIASIGKREVIATLAEHHARECESPLGITLAQAISAGEKMDLTLQKATELGINAIQPLESERSVVKLSGERAEKRAAHWQGVVISACEQCGRNRVPPVAPIRRYTDWLGEAGKESRRLMLSPSATQSLRDLPAPDLPVTLLIGPEGGFSENEIAAATMCGFTPVRLGARILRTETAALAALAAMQALWGDF